MEGEEELEDQPWDDDMEEEILSEEEFGDFVQLINEAREWRDRTGEDVGLEELEMLAKEITESRRKLNEELQDLSSDMASTWLLELRQENLERGLRHTLAYASVGLTPEMLADATDDFMHLAEDSEDDDFRRLRKELRAQMSKLSRREKEELLKEMVDNNRIDDAQYRYLRSEFM